VIRHSGPLVYVLRALPCRAPLRALQVIRAPMRA